MSWRVDEKTREMIEGLLRSRKPEEPPRELEEAALRTLDAAGGGLAALRKRAREPVVPRSPQLSRAFAWCAVGVMGLAVGLALFKAPLGVKQQSAARRAPVAEAPPTAAVPPRASVAPAGGPAGPTFLPGGPAVELAPHSGAAPYTTTDAFGGARARSARLQPPSTRAPEVLPPVHAEGMTTLEAESPAASPAVAEDRAVRPLGEAEEAKSLGAPVPPSMPQPRLGTYPDLGKYSQPWNEVVTDRKQIAQAEVEVAVRDLQDAVKTVRRITEEAGGFVAAHDVTDTRQDGKATFTLRVPSDKLEWVVRQVEDLGRVEKSKARSIDVTERYVGQGGTIRELSAREAELVAEYEKTTDSARRSRLRSEIEEIRRQRDALKQDLQGLKSEVEMSTVQVTLYKRGFGFSPMSTRPGDPLDPGSAWVGAARLGARVLQLILAAVLYVLALAPIWLPLVGAAWWFKRPRRARGATENS